MFGKKSLLLAYGLLFLFIFFVGFYGAQMNNGWEELKSAFEWITTYFLPWIGFVILILIYRKMK